MTVYRNGTARTAFLKAFDMSTLTTPPNPFADSVTADRQERNQAEGNGENSAAAFIPGAAHQPGGPLQSVENICFRLTSARRNLATESYGPWYLISNEAPILAAGEHFLGMSAVAYLSKNNNIMIAVEAGRHLATREILVRLWNRETMIGHCVVTLEASRYSERAVALAMVGSWNGLPIDGLITFQVPIIAGEEC